MKFVVVAALVALTATPAAACPTGARCVRADAAREETPAPKRTVQPLELRVDAPAPRDPWRLDVVPAKHASDEMPWIWQVLRREVYAQMPRYRDDALTFVLSPVVVTGSFDTVPGVGIAGDF
ncbi:MAG TPA: hypothetical protein VFO79_14050 [Xanthomonadales bacterium]|nr:hypothetical protein [Xanthomonadales bacterium]